MTVRLPTVGGTGEGEPFDAVGAVKAPEARDDPGVPVVAIAGARSTSAMLPWADALVRALVEQGAVPAGLVVRRTSHGRDTEPGDASDPLVRAGAQPVWRVRTDPARAPEALDEAWARLPRDRWVVAVGNDVPALVRPRLTLLVSGGLAPAAWSASARALRDRLDVEVCDVRPAMAGHLARHLLRAAGSTAAD